GMADDGGLTILGGSYPTTSPHISDDVHAMTNWLEAAGLPVYHAEVDLGSRGRWHRVLAGAYQDQDAARRDVARLKAAAPTLDPRIVDARAATAVGMGLP